ncbi:MAG: MotA/TolQ/ExbB proton channel family protein [Planctomycetes bacterium]|nr:MotA/TolQ/ExbB proton channel family protein [Planctomycetota bacterium]
MDSFLEQLTVVWDEARKIWFNGSWCMPPLALLAFITFALGINSQLRLSGKQFRAVPEPLWRRWIEVPARREGAIGRLLDIVAGQRTIKEQATAFAEVRAVELAPFTRDLRVMKVCIAAAPLIGLLGTVTGMLSTFGALAHGSGGDKTMAMVSKGISEALITTETGLVVALPGLFFRYHISRRFEEYRAFLAHLETACTQHLYRRTKSKRRGNSGAAA